ncbi:MAG: hypothetical protein HOP07_02910 [Bacteriovoracaceae bacterium]|nr:hypothetical protein [Bacteriovoracaceae bacterium]
MKGYKTYNESMKRLICIIVIFTIGINFQVLAVDSVTEDKFVSDQMSACNKNTAMEWNSTLNRCVGKVEARAQRNEAKACNEITDIEQRKSCHLQLASANTGVNGDPNAVGEKMSSLQSQSAIVNTATTIVSAINYFGKDGQESNCMSKNILGITSLGGFLTDIYLKIKTKKKLKALQDKFQIESKDSAYNTQVMALQYLKEEQMTVKEIASLEKKRQMLLMIGYGAAAATAGYEMMTTPNCNEKPKPAEPQKVVTASAPDTATATASAPETEGATTYPVKESKVEVRELDSISPPSNSPAPVEAVAASPAPAAYNKYDELNSVRDGNVYRSVIKDSTGKVTGVVHNGQFYGNVKEVNGQWLAVGKPSGKFNYDTATWPGGNVKDTALTVGYGLQLR